MKLYEIHMQIAAIAPINGVASDGSIDFFVEATEEQKSAAVALMAELLPQLTD